MRTEVRNQSAPDAPANDPMAIAMEAFRQVMEKEEKCRVLHIGGTNERALKAAVYSYVAIAYPATIAALKGAVGALEFSRDYHKDLGNEEQAFCQDRLDAALKAIFYAEGK